MVEASKYSTGISFFHGEALPCLFITLFLRFILLKAEVTKQ